MSDLLSVRDLRVTFQIRPEGAMPWTRPNPLRAVNGVDFALAPGETLGVVGESGCGKSTLAQLLMGIFIDLLVREQLEGRDVTQLAATTILGTLRAFIAPKSD